VTPRVHKTRISGDAGVESVEDVEVNLNDLLALAVNSFHEDRKDLELVRETVDLLANGSTLQQSSAFFMLLYACALFCDAVVIDKSGDQSLFQQSLVDEIFRTIQNQMERT